jgi:myo-inositol 2-dehydrogenase/D-chiro-inositol 1-dehydrogenase
MDRRNFLGSSGLAMAGASFLNASAGDAVQVGCIGVGGRGTFHLNNLLKMPNVAVRAICDINPEHLANAQELVVKAGQPKPKGYSDWKKLLDSKEVEAVASALPVYLHASCYLDTVAAGKDIYAEKPLCMTWAECERVAAAVSKSKVIFQVGFQRRADPHFVETIEQIHKGELGKLVEGRVAWSNSWGPFGGWFGHRKQSGDWMVEQACHNWDVIVWANQCQAVRAAGFGTTGLFRDTPAVIDHVKNIKGIEPDRDVYDYYSGVIELANGVVVNIIHSWVAPNKFNEEYTKLIGLRGGIDFNSGTFSYRPDTNLPDRQGSSSTGKIDSSYLAVESFLRCVKTRNKPIATVENGRDAVMCSLLMREAVYTKEIVTLDTLKKRSLPT